MAWIQYYADMQKRCQPLAWAMSRLKSGMENDLKEKRKGAQPGSIRLSPDNETCLFPMYYRDFLKMWKDSEFFVRKQIKNGVSRQSLSSFGLSCQNLLKKIYRQRISNGNKHWNGKIINFPTNFFVAQVGTWFHWQVFNQLSSLERWAANFPLIALPFTSPSCNKLPRLFA